MNQIKYDLQKNDEGGLSVVIENDIAGKQEDIYAIFQLTNAMLDNLIDTHEHTEDVEEQKYFKRLIGCSNFVKEVSESLEERLLAIMKYQNARDN
jgi:hypothetical protein